MSSSSNRPRRATERLSDLQTLAYTEDSAGVGTLALSHPPVNALGRRLVEELGEALEVLAADGSVRTLVVTGKGRTFCAGADLKERQSMSEAEVRTFVSALSRTCADLASLPFPTIAAINGTAAGGGCELALACDFRLLDASGRIGLPETTLGIVPGAGGTQRLPRLIGPSRAKKWIFSGRLFTAKEALADGVIDGIAPRESLLEAAAEMAAGMAHAAPLAVRAAKRAIDAALGLSLGEGLAMEQQAYEDILGTEDRREALAAFREKRPPIFKGR
ncbi:MAG: enoyl-CoA hydratase-related protein [Acidobacteriota bacterium]